MLTKSTADATSPTKAAHLVPVPGRSRPGSLEGAGVELDFINAPYPFGVLVAPPSTASNSVRPTAKARCQGETRASQDISFDTQSHGETCPEREAKCHEGETGGKKFHRADHADHRQRVHHKRDDRDDETE